MSLSPEFLQFITQYTNAVLNKINRTITRKITTTFQDSDEVIPSSKLVKDEFTTVRGEIPTKTSDLTNDSGFLTQHQDIRGKEDKSNKVGSLSSNSTNDEYPSAKAVYDDVTNKYNTLSNGLTSISDGLTTTNNTLRTHTHGNITNDGKITNQASKNVVTDSNGKITTEAKPTIPSANATATNIKMNGTQSAGSLTTFAKADHVHPVDTSRAAASHTHDDRYYTETEINTKLSDYLTSDDASETYQPKGNYVTTSAIKNDLTTGGASNVLSAEQGKTLKGLIDGKPSLGTTATTAAKGDHNHDNTYLKTGTGTVTSTNIADGTIVNGDIADDTIESGKIKDGTIVNGDIANTTITGGKLVNGTITATQLASNSVETTKIKNGAVTNDKLSATIIPNGTETNPNSLNNYTSLGFYYQSANTNTTYIEQLPESGKAFWLLVEDWGTASYTKQTLTHYNSNKTYIRIRQQGTWGNWVELTKDTNTTYSADNSTLQLSSTTFSVKDGGITNAKLADKSSLITEYIVGTHGQTATPTWTGTSTKITSLQAGQVIYFKMTSAGTNAGDTLNLTLADGTTTGAKQIYYNGATTKLATQFPVNTVLQLVYDGTSWRCTAIQDTNNYDRMANAAQVINGESTQIASGTLVYGKSDGNYYKIAANGTLDIRYPILWLGAAVNSGSPAGNIYSTYGSVNITTTVSEKSLTASKMCYLEGTLNENIFTISSKVFVSDDALENGKYYIALGYMTNATNLRFTNNDRTIYTRTANKLIPVGHKTPQKTSELVNNSGFITNQDIVSRVMSVFTSNFSKSSWIPMLAGVYNYNPNTLDPSLITKEQYETLIGKEVNYDEIAESVFYQALSSSFSSEQSFLISFGIETFEGTTRKYLGYKYAGQNSDYSIFPVNTSKEDIANKTTQISQASTDTEYPSAKAVYDAIPSDTVTLTATLENGTTKTFTIYGNENTGD